MPPSPRPIHAAAPIAPIAPKAMCDLYRCGMPATASLRGLNHCHHHKGWAASDEADGLRAQKGVR